MAETLEQFRLLDDKLNKTQQKLEENSPKKEQEHDIALDVSEHRKNEN